MQEHQLFVTIPPLAEQDTARPLLTMASKLEKKELQIPPFQREFVWTEPQIRSWCQSVVQQKAIGCVVTYQIAGGGPVFLADGLQRLTATRRFLKNPGLYGFEFDSEQAGAFADSFTITVQHRHYKNHLEAMEAFQKLNSGTALTAKEYYSGFLALTDTGEIVIRDIPALVRECEGPLLRLAHRKNRGGDHALDRDCYALFLQYIERTDSMQFWGVTQAVSSAKPGPVVEKELARWLEEKHISSEELEKLIADFRKFMSEQCVELLAIRDGTGGKGYAMSHTLVRWLLHLAIWRKNTGRPFSQYKDLVSNMLGYLAGTYKRLTSRFVLPRMEPKLDVTLNIGSLSKLLQICTAFESPLYEGQKRKRMHVSAGYHSSHIEPFSINGNGEMIAEPGPSNMSRGASPMARS